MNDELYHHGVRGQKWGKRNGPPYPLNSKGKSNLRKQRMDSYGKGDSKTGMSAFISQFENERSLNVTRKYTENGKEIVDKMNPKEDRWAIGNMNGGSQSFSEAINNVNRMRSQEPNASQWQNNCVNCSVALINRKKGFWAGAGPNTDGVANEAIGYYFDGTKRESPSYDKVEETIMAHGPGSYGVMGTKTKFGNGHETVWEIDENNNLSIYDAQPIGGKHYKSFAEYKNTLGVEDWGGTSVYDLTNATPNLTNQFEDHAIYPDSVGYSTTWRTKDRQYHGYSKEEVPYLEDRMRMYGLK